MLREAERGLIKKKKREKLRGTGDSQRDKQN